MASQNSAGLMVTFIDYCKCKSCLVPRLPVLYKLVLYKLVFIVELENTRLYSSQQDLKWASTLYLLFRSCWKEYSLVFQVGTVKSSLNRMGSLGTRRENVVSLLPKTTLQARMQEGGMLCGGCVFVITYMYKCRPASAEMWSIDCSCFASNSVYFLCGSDENDSYYISLDIERVLCMCTVLLKWCWF